MTLLKIHKADIDKYRADRSSDKWITSSCYIHLQWIGPSGSEVIPLFHNVTISGTTEPDCSFTIYYYPNQVGAVAARNATSCKQHAVDKPDRADMQLVSIVAYYYYNYITMISHCLDGTKH